MRRFVPLVLLWLLAMGVPLTAHASSQEDPSMLAGHTIMLVQHAESDDDPPPADDTAPKLATAFNSLYRTKEERRRRQGKALGAAMLWSGAAWGVMGLLTMYMGAEVGLIGIFVMAPLAPLFVSFIIANRMGPHFKGPFWKPFVGGLAGATAGALITASMGFLADDRNLIIPGFLAVIIGSLVMFVTPAVGAWVGAISGQDDIERRKFVMVGPTPSGIHGQDVGFGLTGRF